MAKIYLEKNVYQATQERLDYIFNEFENIFVSFSGGKDSGVVLNLAIDKARQLNRRIGVVFIDLEAMYSYTIEYIERMIINNLDVLDPYWICLPMTSPNALSYYQPTWITWEKEKQPIWVRDMPHHEFVINEENNPINFYQKNMSFEKFVLEIADWLGKGKKTAALIGIRTDESLNRYRSLTREKSMYKDKNYSTLVMNQSFNFYPIYDWSVEDIWTYNARFKKDYNKLYDIFYKAGVSVHKMRVDEPFGNEEKAGLNMFRIIEPQTWAKVANRVSGANFGNIYSGNKIMTHEYTLPKGHTWKSFTQFLLETLPKETADNYRSKFSKFITYWTTVGCPLPNSYIKILETKYPSKIKNTHQYSKRGLGDKEVIKFNEVVDEIPELDSKDDILTWKRMAMAIIKNDYICKSLSFSITKNLTKKQEELVEKYRRIL